MVRLPKFMFGMAFKGLFDCLEHFISPPKNETIDVTIISYKINDEKRYLKTIISADSVMNFSMVVAH